MELINLILGLAIAVAVIIDYKAKFFILNHVEKYNMFIHVIDYKLLKELTKNSDPEISKKAKKHYKNVIISTIVIIVSMVIFMAQNAY